MKNKWIIIILLILTIISIVKAQSKREYVINLESYIYENTKLKSNEYKFKDISYNPYGNIVYAYTVYKAKGTLLININIPYNSIGYRLIENPKEVNSISIGYDNTILMNSIAGENKLYYLSSSGLKSIESPSFNTSRIKAFLNGYYWSGFKYLNNEKKIKQEQYLFIFQNLKIKEYPLSKISQTINPPFNYTLINNNNLLIEKIDKKEKKQKLYIYNLTNQEIKEIENSNKIITGNIMNNKLYYLIENENSIKVKSINLINLNQNDEYEIKKEDLNILNFQIGFQKFLINYFKDNKIISIIYNDRFEQIKKIENEKIYPILYSIPNKNGYFYPYKDSIQVIELE